MKKLRHITVGDEVYEYVVGQEYLIIRKDGKKVDAISICELLGIDPYFMERCSKHVHVTPSHVEEYIRRLRRCSV